MDAIIKAIGKTPSLATLPLRVEEGYLPALLTQSGGAMRALGAAMLRRETDRPIFVLCTDETNAGTLAADLEAMLGESVVQLTGRDLALRDIEVVSRQEEQRRLRALDALYAGRARRGVHRFRPSAAHAAAGYSGKRRLYAPSRRGRGPRSARARACLRVATAAATWWRAPASFRAAAVFLTSSPPARSAPCAPSSGATRSTPWAFSTPTRSAARRISNPSVCCPRANRSLIPAAPGASPRSF